MQNIISASELYELSSELSLVILDATFATALAKRNYYKEHIKNARFFDINDFADHNSDLPHMLPPAKEFAVKAGDMGISETDHIVIYDQQGMFSAARGWWMFRIMGAKKVQVLDGGLPSWKSHGYETVGDIAQLGLPKKKFNACFDKTKVKNAEQVLLASQGGAKIVDARAHNRFTGEVKEARPKMRQGRIPSSLNLHYKDLLDKDNHFLPLEQLRSKLSSLNLEHNEPVITSCGSGVTACIVALAFDEIGHSDYAVYDGSWSEWGARKDLPIANG